MKTIILETASHRNEQRLLLKFDYDTILIEKVKKLKGVRWSQSRKCWHIPVENYTINELKEYFKNVLFAYNDSSKSNSSPTACLNNTGNIEEKITLNINVSKNIFYATFPYELKEQFKKLEGAWWHPGARIWSAINSNENLEQMKRIALSGGFTLSIINEGLKPKTALPSRGIVSKRIEPDPRFERFMLLQGKKESTIRQYKSYISWFLSENGGIDFANNSIEQIQKFIHEKVINQHFGQSQQNGVISAIKLYFLVIYDMVINTDDIPRPKRERPLPKVISEDEFVKMVSVTQNHKHKLILLLLYGCGLRRGELCRLKVEDVDFEREMIYIKGKGNKYRAVNPGNKLLMLIGNYIKSYLPEFYLIEGVDKMSYSGTSVGIIVRKAAHKADIKRRVHAHMLRHSYATHHMERGIELRLIQETMGHASSKTTEIYTYVSRKSIKKMPNLLDELKI